ncbi:hypothetical protein DM826_06810 [Halonotius aquaticus]|uniref:Uncharacterized protein n=1 Tax=Halonotius aquaticus TaxID=2216978 RepID=A0A3A6PP00_9EURY|nr:hypothetical protein [Halonotius aquaticus]RJX43311.1 hypothetical protein DM826_06810 [Halonotius aquaticus]
MRALPLFLAALLVTATVGAGAMVPAESDAAGVSAATTATATAAPLQVTAGGDRTTETANATPRNVLPLRAGTIDRSSLRRHHVDIGPAAGFETAAATDALATGAIEQNLSAESVETDRLAASVDAMAATADRLRQREADAITAFAAGDRDPEPLLEELVLISQTADRLRDRVDVIDARIEATARDDQRALSDRLTTIDYELRMLDGPVRAYAADVFSGERPAGRVSIQAGPENFELTAIDDGSYLREAYRFDNRATGGQITAATAEDIVADQYPWFWERRSGGTWSIGGPGSLSLVSIEIDEGSLQTFIDGTTEQRFVEHQQIALDEIVPVTRTTKRQDGLAVTVERTYVGGPLDVRVVDADTGQPVAADVSIGQNGQESVFVGSTSDGGDVWTLTPRGTFTLTILAEDDSAAFVELTPQDADSVL